MVLDYICLMMLDKGGYMENMCGRYGTAVAKILWEKAPITTREIIDIGAKEFNWKRTNDLYDVKTFMRSGNLYQ